ncbi:hypothetical protein [Sulfolobus spindle-shaped virus]|nr:hypothetical protein [Sulfolobus spindle-shaped virus]AZG03115.1 hypothetical protein [Sulfolobus spindle-shaped virus]AZG03393.1 hypothetical protein [Sulfolobus spindle-shaped virus]
MNQKQLTEDELDVTKVPVIKKHLHKVLERGRVRSTVLYN